MTYAFTASHVAQAEALLATQLKDSTQLKALLESYIAQVQQLETAFELLFSQRGLGTAIGGLVYDGIGEIVGLPRELRTDADYLARLKTQVLANASSGTIEDVISVLQLLFDPVIVTEEGNAAFRVEASDVLTDDTATAAVDLLRQVKAAGVRVLFVYPTDDDAPYFSFGPDPDVDGVSEGFDTGAFVGGVQISI